MFCYTVWLAGAGRGLRNGGYSYENSRDAVAFYVKNVHTLIDIPPRRIFQIAKVIADNRHPVQREQRLSDMLRPDDQRPKLKLPAPWTTVLLWPDAAPTRGEPSPTPEPIGPEPAPEPETIIPEWVAREPEPHDAQTDIPVEPVEDPVAEHGEPISDINPSANFEPHPLDLPLRPG